MTPGERLTVLLFLASGVAWGLALWQTAAALGA